MKFLTRLADTLVAQRGIDPRRVFAAGVSRGGHMAYRLALEAPSRFRAVAAVSASLPVPRNSKCRPAAQGTSSVLIMNGTKDPINPFAGGEVTFLGLLKRGNVRSSRDSGQYLADLDRIAAAPRTHEEPGTDGMRVETVTWQGAGPAEVELVAIHGGGHGMPQPWWRYPRLLGPSPTQPDGPKLIWEFFERQRR